MPGHCGTLARALTFGMGYRRKLVSAALLAGAGLLLLAWVARLSRSLSDQRLSLSPSSSNPRVRGPTGHTARTSNLSVPEDRAKPGGRDPACGGPAARIGPLSASRSGESTAWCRERTGSPSGRSGTSSSWTSGALAAPSRLECPVAEARSGSGRSAAGRWSRHRCEIRLAVARLRGSVRSRHPDPVIYLAGGPGEPENAPVRPRRAVGGARPRGGWSARTTKAGKRSRARSGSGQLRPRCWPASAPSGKRASM